MLVVWVLVAVVLGGATTGAGADVVVTGGAEFVVTGGGAECVVVGGGAECVVVVDALWAGALWCWTAGFLVVVVVVDVVEVEVVAGVDAAALVELVLDEPPPPHPAIATAAKIVLSSAFFINPAPVLARKLQRSHYKTPPAAKRFETA
ncbi:MAG TPA: hypothetical protein VMA96_15940 [Solirubrobacteraceae bacterium]|nr:hypothetical protein [Solirubrobacteraceae bacterium]